MTKVVTAKEMRALDHHTINEVGIPALVLMERAALAIADHILALPKEKRHQVVVVVGNGNNGGDGLAVARLLHLAGTPVKLLFVMPPAQASEENRVQQHTCAYYQIPATTDLAALKDATLIVDAIFGIGIDREVTGHYREVIEAVNQAPAPALQSYEYIVSNSLSVFLIIVGCWGFAGVFNFSRPIGVTTKRRSTASKNTSEPLSTYTSRACFCNFRIVL